MARAPMSPSTARAIWRAQDAANVKTRAEWGRTHVRVRRNLKIWLSEAKARCADPVAYVLNADNSVSRYALSPQGFLSLEGKAHPE